MDPIFYPALNQEDDFIAIPQLKFRVALKLGVFMQQLELEDKVNS